MGVEHLVKCNWIARFLLCKLRTSGQLLNQALLIPLPQGIWQLLGQSCPTWIRRTQHLRCCRNPSISLSANSALSALIAQNALNAMLYYPMECFATLWSIARDGNDSLPKWQMMKWSQVSYTELLSRGIRITVSKYKADSARQIVHAQQRICPSEQGGCECQIGTGR